MRQSRLNVYGLAAAARYGVTEALGLGVRAEALWAQDVGYLPSGAFDGWTQWGPANNDGTIWEITGTADYALTDNLTLLGEVRYDNATIRSGTDDFFVDGRDGNRQRDQVLAIVQMMYSF